jgi:hypothetical protein
MFGAFLRLLVFLAAISLLPSAAFATPLNLTLLLPDVVSGTIDVVYDAGTDTFSASGFAFELDDDGVLPNIQLDAPGDFDIIAAIDEFGALSAGTLSITGTIASEGYNSGTLLTGSLSDFGWAGDASGMIFEFEFDVTGGDLAPVYGGLPGGVILGTTLSTPPGFSGFGSSFNNRIFDFEGTGAGGADTAPIPEPSTALLLGAGLGALALYRRRNR